jgi:3-hydroxyacyl-CoA dehydrogenase
VLRRMEDVRKPLVAAIHGHALGGGLEVAMGCHYRVARRDAIVGQPEVLLGIIPGAGGTQRLPRLCGVAAAIDLCTTGRMVTALEAHEMGLVDALTDGDVVKAALAFAADRARVGATRKAREIELSAEAVREGIAACDTAEARLRAAPVPAAWRAVTAIRAGLAEGFDAGSSLERELFADCALSLESKALRHLFFAERAAARTPKLSGQPEIGHVKRAAIVGAGTMGVGIAIAYASAGIDVLLKDVNDAALESGLSTLKQICRSAAAKGRMTPEASERVISAVTPVTTYDGFDAADIVVEAVFEDLEHPGH